MVRAVRGRGRKRTWLAYLLYLFGGLFGLHHFYLGRDFSAFLWGSTLGGFGLGFLLDLFRLPGLVADANEDELSMKLYRTEKQYRKKPVWRLERVFYQLATGTLYDILFSGSIPPEWKDEWYYYRIVHCVVASLACSLGVWIAGNIGRQKVDFTYPLRGGLLTYAMMWYLKEEPNSFWMSVGATIAAQHNREFRDFGALQRRTKQGFCRRCLVLAFGTLLLTGGWVGYTVMNGEITSEDGEQVKIRDAIRNFFSSEAWLQMRIAFKQLWQELTKDGWSGFFTKLKDLVDIDGEDRALRTLGLTRQNTDAEIKSTYRKLARQWHPDRNKGNEREASLKFMEIQEAYEVLTKLKSLRAKKSTDNKARRDGPSRTDL